MPSPVTEKQVIAQSNSSVFLYIPNLIGYTRIILASLSLYYMPWHPKVCVSLYCISCLLDAVDGNAARYFNQCSKFGAVLDMVTDRCTTTCLLCFLSLQYPQWTILFQFLISLDFSSHYMHMYRQVFFFIVLYELRIKYHSSSMISGSSSHKKISEEQSWYLRIYYTNNIVLFIMCAGNELFFVALYVLKFIGSLNMFWYIALSVTGVICFAKQFINIVQIVNASKTLAHIDQEDKEKELAGKNN
ncbi:CDP-alcohol phosphatidyltransferase-domain-containing protein [Gilbertella persicaria]|uniref:CDP-alcohol phosphatidyltransferase-domain-containing protein n=1 Tax=Gilbertella persicaria TaxID=101096 RepID=UPI00221E6255|nr:CDP-alcohol phosphatidyltransferase-domain-containing protein [Gilbertella persicaria]KAI8047528.1 CDP-alcohol phosphatidyltransferase-domain-containing protein [Gilbertella persicaria]